MHCDPLREPPPAAYTAKASLASVKKREERVGKRREGMSVMTV
jgi:hypothetical protein